MTDWLQTGSRSNGQDWIKGLLQEQTQRTAGRQIAGGNLRAGANTLLSSGDLRSGLALTEQADAQAAAGEEQQIAFTLQAVAALKRAKEAGQDVLTAYDEMAPAFQQLGTTPEQIAQMRQGLGANPDGFLQTVEQIAGSRARELEIINYGSGRGGAAVDKATGQIVNEFGPERDPMNVGGVLIDPTSREVILDTREPKYQTVTNVDGTTSVVAIDQPAPIRGGAASGGGSTDLNSILDGVIRREGGFVARDGRSGAPANFGINQRANPDIDVANLTEPRARQIYQERYINPVVEAGVEGPILEAVVDFGINAGVERSLDFWRQSGGDIDEFNRLRLAHYRSLPDYQQNGRSWERRVAETTPGQRGATVPVQGGARVVAQGRGGAAARLLTEAEKTAEGLPVGGVYQRNADGTTTQVTAPGAGGGRGGGSYDATTRGALQAARNAADAARERAANAQRFVSLNRQRSTGPGARIAGPALALDPIYGEMRAIGAKLVPGEREPGSGTMSDRDVSLYREAVMGVQNVGPTNAALARVISAQADRDAEYSAFLDEYATRNGNIVGATEDWTAYVNSNPLFEEGQDGNTRVRPRVQSWREFMGFGERQRGGARGGGSAAPAASRPAASRRRNLNEGLTEAQRGWVSRYGQSEGGRPPGTRQNPYLLNPRDPNVGWARIPSGGYFLHPDGTVRQKP